MGRTEDYRIIPALAGNTVSGHGSGGQRPDHPRSRGEYPPVSTRLLQLLGSSPLSRGIPARGAPLDPARGIIPALAGNTGRRSRGRVRGRDHPRSRGEYLVASRRAKTPTRIIPALAGNTPLCGRVFPDCADHPRSRGEYLSLMTADFLVAGSSPLSRGIPTGEVNILEGRGIIPALAGNTFSDHTGYNGGEDHPRSRGEYSLSIRPAPCEYGSSPLSRGIPSLNARRAHRFRIIPALAGNTRALRPGRRSRTDHPRSRGEYPTRSHGPGTRTGSSPLSRGILDALGHLLDCGGIIPALAGNTVEGDAVADGGLDHPRSRGEYRQGQGRMMRPRGSSPLSRGILFLDLERGEFPRIIPALAGNTPSGQPYGRRSTDHPRSRGEYFG